MKCPHCFVGFHDDSANNYIGKDNDGGWVISSRTCPEREPNKGRVDKQISALIELHKIIQLDNKTFRRNI